MTAGANEPEPATMDRETGAAGLRRWVGAEGGGPPVSRFPAYAGPALLIALVALLFRQVVLSGPGHVVSVEGGDIQTQFLGWLAYGFGRLARGEIPLWDDFAFCGRPFIGAWQSAVFYPPNWINLFLPPAYAVNLLVPAHVFLAGYLTFRWLRYKRFSASAATLGGVSYMMSGAVLGHCYPGHLTWVYVVAWIPALFHCIDGMVDTGRWVYAWLGAGVVAVMVLGGYPQPVYMAGLAGFLYAALCLAGSHHRRRLVLGTAMAAVLGLAMSAVQWVPGVEMARESVRSVGGAGARDIDFAGSFSLPVKNLLLALSPYALGGPSAQTYAGDWLLWEVWPYVGAIAAVLAVAGVVTFDPEWAQGRRWAATMVLLAVLMALGVNTPVYRAAFDAIPGVGAFRAPGRWLVVAALFVTPLLAAGVDALRLRRRAAVVVAGAVLGLAAAGMGAMAGSMRVRGPGWEQPALLLSAVVLGVGFVLVVAGRWRWGGAFPALLAVGVVELTVSGWRMVTVCRSGPEVPALWAAVAERAAEGTRVHVTSDALAGLVRPLGLEIVAGYDPFQGKRWAQYVAASQGMDPRNVREVTGVLQWMPAWRLLRPAYLLDGESVTPLPDPLPRVLLVPRAEVVKEWSTRLARLMSPEFDPREKVLLETAPRFAAVEPADTGEAAAITGAPSAVVISERRTDGPEVLRVRVKTGGGGGVGTGGGAGMFLVITDAYYDGWRARLTSPSGQTFETEVMPANHVVRAVAVPPGEWTVTLTYAPAGWLVARWVTPAGLGVWVVLGLVWRRGLREGLRGPVEG